MQAFTLCAVNLKLYALTDVGLELANGDSGTGSGFNCPAKLRHQT
jgi:hypothetical protein